MLALTVEPAQIVVGILVGAVAFLLAWFLLGSAARQKQDRERAQRMRAVIQPGQQQGGAGAVNPAVGRVDPRQRHEVRDAVRRVSWVQRAPRRRARGRRGVAAFGRVRGGVRPRGAGVRRARRGAPAQLASGAGRGRRRRARSQRCSCAALSASEPTSCGSSCRTCSRSWRRRCARGTASCSRSTRWPRRSHIRPRPSSSGSSRRSGWAGPPRTRSSPSPSAWGARTSSGRSSRSTSSGRSAGTWPRSSTPSPTRCASARCCAGRSRCSPRRVDSRPGCSGLLPFGIALYMFAVNPDYIGLLLEIDLRHHHVDRGRSPAGGGDPLDEEDRGYRCLTSGWFCRSRLCSWRSCWSACTSIRRGRRSSARCACSRPRSSVRAVSRLPQPNLREESLKENFGSRVLVPIVGRAGKLAQTRHTARRPGAHREEADARGKSRRAGTPSASSRSRSSARSRGSWLRSFLLQIDLSSPRSSSS